MVLLQVVEHAQPKEISSMGAYPYVCAKCTGKRMVKPIGKLVPVS